MVVTEATYVKELTTYKPKAEPAANEKADEKALEGVPAEDSKITQSKQEDAEEPEKTAQERENKEEKEKENKEKKEKENRGEKEKVRKPRILKPRFQDQLRSQLSRL